MGIMPLRIYIRGAAAAEIQGRSSKTAAYILYYHYVFRTKYNTPAVTAEIAGRLLDILDHVCEERGYVLFAAAIMPDHVHLVLSLTPTIAPADAMRYIKGRLAHDLHKEMGEGGGSMWGDGYYVEAVGKKNVHQVLHYVTRQDEHHDDTPA